MGRVARDEAVASATTPRQLSSIDYARYVNVLDYIAGARQPRIAQLPASDPTPSVEIGYDGWVFPKGGVAFVWMLESELVHT